MTKSKLIKMFFLVVVIILFTGITIYLYPTLKNLSTPEGQVSFKEKIQNAGFLGLIIFLFLQIAQIFLFILPGEPLEILAGICYGGINGTILIIISIFISATMIYFMTKYFGKKFIYSFSNKEQIDKLENSTLFKNAKNIEYIMFVLFLIPGTPKDMLTYLGCILPINPIKFIIVSTIARLPSIISSTFAGEFIIEANFNIALYIYIITFFLVGIVLLLMCKFDKSKITENIFKNK